MSVAAAVQDVSASDVVSDNAPGPGGDRGEEGGGGGGGGGGRGDGGGGGGHEVALSFAPDAQDMQKPSSCPPAQPRRKNLEDGGKGGGGGGGGGGRRQREGALTGAATGKGGARRSWGNAPLGRNLEGKASKPTSGAGGGAGGSGAGVVNVYIEGSKQDKQRLSGSASSSPRGRRMVAAFGPGQGDSPRAKPLAAEDGAEAAPSKSRPPIVSSIPPRPPMGSDRRTKPRVQEGTEDRKEAPIVAAGTGGSGAPRPPTSEHRGGGGSSSRPSTTQRGTGSASGGMRGGKLVYQPPEKKEYKTFPNVKRNKAFYAAIRTLQAAIRKRQTSDSHALFVQTGKLFVRRYGMLWARRVYAERVAAGRAINIYAKSFASKSFWIMYRRAAWLATTLAVRTTYVELHRTRILSAQLLEASSRRDAPRARYIKRVTKVRGDIERYNNLAGRQKQVVKFNMSYHIGHGFKEIKIRALQSAAEQTQGYLLNSLNTYQRLAMINSVDIGEQQRNLHLKGEGGASPRQPPSPRERADVPRSPLADRVSASRGPLPLLSCIEETLSPATPFPRPPPAPIVQYETFRPSLSDREAGGGGGQAAPYAMQFPPLVGAESVVEAASPSRRPPPGFARSLHAGSAQGRSRPDHTGLPVIDKHRASMRPEGTYVALDVSYKYDEIAKVSSGVRKRAANALAVSTDAAAVLMAGVYIEEVVEQDAMLLAVAVIDGLRREEAEARRRALEEEERNSTEYLFIQVVSGANLPAGSSGFVKVAVGNQEPYCTMVVWGEEPSWGECFASIVPKTLSPRSATISLFDDRSVVGQAHKLIGNASVEVDSIPLGGEESIIWLDMLSPNAKDEKEEGGDELVIELIEAKNLPAADRGGTSDPYAIIKYNGEVVQSRVVNKTLNPQWREVFILPLAPHPGERGSIRIDVYDKDFNLFGGKKSLGDFLGGVDVPVGVEPGGSASDQWLELGGEGGKGQVNVRLKGKRGKKTGVVEPVRVEVSMSRQKQVLPPPEKRDDLYVSIIACEGSAEIARQAVLTLDHNVERLPLPPPPVGTDGGHYAHWDTLFEGSFIYVYLSETRVPPSVHPRVPPKIIGSGGRVPLASLKVGEPQEAWVSLGEGGRVLLRLVRMVKCTHQMEVVCLIKAAKGLEAADRGGTSDPFAEVRVGKSQKKRTKVIPKELNPVWDETFILPLDGAITARQDVTVEIFDHDLVGASDFLGRIRIDCKRLCLGLPLEGWHPLEGRKQGEGAQGGLEVRLLKRDRKKKEEFLIEVIEARKLTAADRGGSSDPFVVVQCEGVKVKTKVIKATLAPEWNETFHVPIPDEILRSTIADGDVQKATFEVYDYNTIGRNTFIGMCEVDLTRTRIGTKTIAKWHSLHMEKPGTTGSGRSTASYKLPQAAYGEIRLQVTRQYAPEGPLRTLSGGADDEVMPTVTVTVVEARDLVAADRGGTSDPFVHIHYPTLKKPLKTAVVSKTLCPVWNEVHVINLKGSKPGASPDLSSESLLRGETDSMESRELPGWSSAPSSDAFDGNLVFEVFDYDLFGSNDFLGRAVVSVLSLKPGEVEDQWITLQPRKGKKDEVKGEIHLKLLMTV